MAGIFRHIILFSVVCFEAAMLFSCSKVLVDVDTGDRVEFNETYIADVRSSIRDSEFISGDAFGVMAYYVPAGEDWDAYKEMAEPDFMYNQKVSYDGQTWSYSPIMYWPHNEGARVNFYAYFPYSEGTGDTGVQITSEGVAGERYFEFILNEEADVDLMVAKAEGLTGGSVVLPFCHMLGKLRFCFKVDKDDGFSYVVNKVKVLKTPKEARYSWDDESFSIISTTHVEAYAGVNGSGHLIDSTEPVPVESFTMYLIPGPLGHVEISMNNEDPVDIDLSDQEIQSGKELTLTVVINLENVSFETSIDDWNEGGSVNGQIK